jgi:hypothetical protein
MNKLIVSLCGAAATAGVLAAAVAPAGADTFIPLPDGHVTARIGSGTVTVDLTHQSAKLSPGMVALPTTRNAWVSGTVHAHITGDGANNGTIQAGYVVGCQVAVGTTNMGVSANGTVGAVGTTNTGPSAAAGSGANFSLAAGGIGYQYLTLDQPTWPKAGAAFKPDVEPAGNPTDTSGNMGWQQPSQSFAFTGDSGSLSWSDTTIGVDGCAGYAQARFYAYVTGATGNHEGSAVLWGKPFTLG